MKIAAIARRESFARPVVRPLQNFDIAHLVSTSTGNSGYLHTHFGSLDR